MSFFDSNGNALDAERLFDEEGGVEMDAAMDASRIVTDESDAQRLFWAQEMANETHGNYSARLLFFRSRPSVPPIKGKRAKQTLPTSAWVEFDCAAVSRRLARWVKAVWVEQPPASRAKSCVLVAVVDTEANRLEAERQVIIARALAKLTAEERDALGHGKG